MRLFAVFTGETRCGGFLSHLFCKGRWGGIRVLCLEGKTLHVFAGGLLGTELGGGSYGGGKTNSLFGLDAAG